MSMSCVMAVNLNVLCVGLKASRGSTNIVLEQPISVELLKQRISPNESAEFYLCHGGSPLSDDHLVTASSGLLVLTAHYRVLGGKGGFGSLIRATGSHINRSSDKSACRDISGRRMRDIKREKKVAEWMAAEKKRKRERAEKRKRKLQKMLEEPKHKFEDSSYMEQIRSTEEGMADSLKQGLSQAGASGEDAGGLAKKPKLWVQSEDWSSSDSEDELSPPVSSEENENTSTEDDGSSTQQTEKDSDKTGQLLQDETGPSTIDHFSPDNGQPSSDNTQPLSVINPASDSIVDTPQSTKGIEEDKSERREAEPVEPVDLSLYSSVEELASVGGERLKVSLQALGLKCGGKPLERAQRLFSTKGKSLDQLPPSLFAKSKTKKR